MREKSAAGNRRLIARNVVINGHRTSIRLEPDMWSGMSELCRRENVSLHALCEVISAEKSVDASLTSAIRTFIMNYYRAAATEDGHHKAKHGYGVILANPSAQTPPISGDDFYRNHKRGMIERKTALARA